ncbi:MAG: TonB-dependent receptor, partial [Sinomicrobium sp.]|nr:TonB-dependent receptor [Sinomicrobium sp.]
DGAAAQYGSDAIAGVINIVLKKSVNELTAGVYAGANFTSEAGPEKSVDGEKINVDLNYGVPIGENGGYVNFSGMFGFRGYTNRMQEWEGTIFNAYNAIERVAAAAGYDIAQLIDDDITDLQMFAPGVSYFDPVYLGQIVAAPDKATLQGLLADDYTEEELTARGMQRSDFNMRVGQSELQNIQFFANMAVPVSSNFEFYAFGGLGFRKGSAAGFYRLPNQERTYTPLYINGFLPEINSDIKDYSLAAGLRGKINEMWNLDISNTFGHNSFAYDITNSNNASLGNATPTEADAGGFSYTENTVNADMSRFYEAIFSGLNIAFGAEFRM